MPFVKIIRHGQVTLPKRFREFLGIEDGDILEVEMLENAIVLKPKVVISKFPEAEEELSIAGKEKIKEALEDYETGKVKSFDNVEELIKDLNS
ncbi:MAG: AbrB/MazE/SpoVT family DNA-binding domain-containing protein [Nitrospirae bacterium]|nr:AbrB/MazE/SpoVT family DNA-binding domain-containing protein [Nitrospirota bacterium]MBF0591359.1 AbrB/MazE/SpoVT family DNA-binding domain-containing protein [Nitrospirota bacterium]